MSTKTTTKSPTVLQELSFEERVGYHMDMNGIVYTAAELEGVAEFADQLIACALRNGAESDS